MYPDAITKVDSEPIASASTRRYDAIIVGAGVAGSALAASLGSQTRSILLLERDLSPPDRIVGELLQPGGCLALKKLGLRDCLDEIEAAEVRGYKVFWGNRVVPVPYPPEAPDKVMQWTDGALWGISTDVKGKGTQLQEGRSFHHGRFVQRLRWKAKRMPGVTVLEAVVNGLVRCSSTNAVVGVQANLKVSAGKSRPVEFFAPLTFVIDGCSSKFRRELLPPSVAPVVRSHFVGLILDTPDPHSTIPAPGHGHVILPKPDKSQLQGDGIGPVLVYQIGKDDTRMLVDIPGGKIPSISNGSLKAYLETHVGPILPASLLPSFHATLNSTDSVKRLRSMPNSYLPALAQGRVADGVVLVGDALNMRHPLTGGGMTVALNDVLILTEELEGADFGNWVEVQDRLDEWYSRRKGVATCVNVLAQALYSLFGADDDNLEVLKEGCFKYFELGGICVSGPISLLSALCPSPLLLLYHFFCVAFYSIWVMFTHPVLPGPGDSTPPLKGGQQFEGRRPSPVDWPGLAVKSFQVFWTACVVILPVLWANM